MIFAERDVVATKDQIELLITLESVQFADEDWQRMESKNESEKIVLNFYGAIQYEDVFGHRFETGFARIRHWGHTGDGHYSWTWSHGFSGSREYNYHRQIKDE
jgi:hypothetical protein